MKKLILLLSLLSFNLQADVTPKYLVTTWLNHPIEATQAYVGLAALQVIASTKNAPDALKLINKISARKKAIRMASDSQIRQAEINKLRHDLVFIGETLLIHEKLVRKFTNYHMKEFK